MFEGIRGESDSSTRRKYKGPLLDPRGMLGLTIQHGLAVVLMGVNDVNDRLLLELVVVDHHREQELIIMTGVEFEVSTCHWVLVLD